jgi:hypothetical protein
MKNIVRIFLVLAALVLPGLIRAGNSDVEIHCTAKKLAETRNPGSGEGGVSKTKENWTYDVTIENKTFQNMANVEIKYVIFFNQEKLGKKEAAQLQRHAGSMTLPSFGAHEKKSLTTEAVELKKANLVGHYHYTSGARPNAQDTLTGLWVRVYVNGQQFAEYANPSTLMKEKWE